tara:strand:- start:616 stop:1659 length:1044 start_codon:yes stop_codon:yes gene_type:complete
MTIDEIEALPIYFILAKGRSGTTLLQTILEAHPNTRAPVESRFLIHFKNRYHKTKKWTPQIREAFFNDVLKEQKINLFWDIDKEKLKYYLRLLPENSSYLLACKMVYLSSGSMFIKGKTTCIIDKNPVYAWLTPLLLEVVPDAKFIHLIRDGRACVNSTIKFHTNRAKSVAKSWSTNNHYIEGFKNKKLENFHTLHYERLLNDPEKTMADICQFLGIAFDPEMLNYHKTVDLSINAYLEGSSSDVSNNIRTMAYNKIHKNLSKPLDPSRINSWKESLTHAQIKYINKICQYCLERYGYIQKSNNNPSSPIYLSSMFTISKTQLYYRLPIWVRELKSKPTLVFLENEQ